MRKRKNTILHVVGNAFFCDLYVAGAMLCHQLSKKLGKKPTRYQRAIIRHTKRKEVNIFSRKRVEKIFFSRNYYQCQWCYWIIANSALDSMKMPVLQQVLFPCDSFEVKYVPYLAKSIWVSLVNYRSKLPSEVNFIHELLKAYLERNYWHQFLSMFTFISIFLLIWVHWHFVFQIMKANHFKVKFFWK